MAGATEIWHGIEQAGRLRVTEVIFGGFWSLVLGIGWLMLFEPGGCGAAKSLLNKQ